MKHKKQDFIKRESYILLLLFIFSLIPVLMISRYIYAQSDDYSYGLYTHLAWNNTHNLLEVIKAAFKTVGVYMETWQGTYTSEFLMALQPGIFSEQMYHIVPMFIIICFFAGTYFFISSITIRWLKMPFEYALGLTSLISLISIQNCRQQAQGFTWYNGAVHYTVIHALWILVLGLNIRLLLAETKKKEAVLSVITSIFSFLVAGGNTLTVLAAVLMNLLIVGFLLINRLKYKKIMRLLIPTLLMIIGMVINFTAKGNDIRLEVMGGKTYGVLPTIGRAFAAGAIYSIKWIDITLIIFLLWLLPFCIGISKRIMGKIVFGYPLLMLIASFCFFSSLWTPNLYTSNETDILRTQNFIYFVFILLIFWNMIYICGYIASKNIHVFDDKKTKFFAPKARLLGCALTILFTLLGLGYVVSQDISHYTSTSAFYAIRNGNAQKWADTIEKNLEILQDDNIKDVFVDRPEVIEEILSSNEIASWRYGLKDYYNKDSVLYKDETR